MTEYQLIKKHGLSANTLHRMKKGETITTKTVDTLCRILQCRVEGIMQYCDVPQKDPPVASPGDIFMP